MFVLPGHGKSYEHDRNQSRDSLDRHSVALRCATASKTSNARWSFRIAQTAPTCILLRRHLKTVVRQTPSIRRLLLARACPPAQSTALNWRSWEVPLLRELGKSAASGFVLRLACSPLQLALAPPFGLFRRHWRQIPLEGWREPSRALLFTPLLTVSAAMVFG